MAACHVPGCNCGGMVHALYDWAQPRWEEKIWGRVQHVFTTSDVAVSHLQTVEGRRCSIHLHRHRHNLFHVVRGTISIIELYNGGGNVGFVRRTLYEGEQHVVRAGLTHWFEVVASGEVIELYWCDDGHAVKIDDIERYDAGGEDAVQLTPATKAAVVKWQKGVLHGAA